MQAMNIGGLLYIKDDKDILVMDASNGQIQSVSIKELIQSQS